MLDDLDLVSSSFLSLLFKNVDVPLLIGICDRCVEPRVVIVTNGGHSLVVFLRQCDLLEVRLDSCYRNSTGQTYSVNAVPHFMTYIPEHSWESLNIHDEHPKKPELVQLWR